MFSLTLITKDKKYENILKVKNKNDFLFTATSIMKNDYIVIENYIDKKLLYLPTNEIILIEAELINE